MRDLELVLEFPLRQNWSDERVQLWYAALNDAAIAWQPERDAGLSRFYILLETKLAACGLHRALAEGFELHMESNGVRTDGFVPDAQEVSFADELADPGTVLQLLEITRSTMAAEAGEDGRHLAVEETDRRTLQLAHDWEALMREHGMWRGGVETWDAFAARFLAEAHRRGLSGKANNLLLRLTVLDDDQRVAELEAQGALRFARFSAEAGRPSPPGMPDEPDDPLTVYRWKQLMTDHGTWLRGSENWDSFVERFRVAARNFGLGQRADELVVRLLPLTDDERVAAFVAQGAPQPHRMLRPPEEGSSTSRRPQ
ncbi:hypothetical protein [Lentzea sp. E54]|uniref:hypothetical protein n=1 Tax=Lentzea xerophila TaxID=3435883 RepID=UPI003DA28155